MLAILRAFLGEYWASLALIVGVLAICGLIYLKIRADAFSEAEQAQTKATLEQLKERNAIDGKVETMSDRERCRHIGGLLDNGQCK